MVHEWLHKAGMHMVTYRRLAEQDAMRTNMATDYLDSRPHRLWLTRNNTLTEMPIGR
jgi:hypothetical protein